MIFEEVSEGIKEAMLARDKVRLEALRGIKKELLEAKTAKGSNGEVTDEQALSIIAKLLKQRKESADIYAKNGREELAEAELQEAKVLESFLPKQLTKEELIPIVKGKIDELGLISSSDAGKLTGILMKTLKGKVDGKLLNEVIRALLA
ncbi:YqeY-like protein [Bacteroidales bacterium KA00251]|nr:YqeY-like protein [Bacteroidales bacterium KA00251]